MDAKDLKEYIIQNDKVVDILEDLGFHKIKDDKVDYITCAVEGYNNPNGFSVIKDTLHCKSFTTHMNFSGGLYDLVMHIKGVEFNECMKYLHRLLGLKYEWNGKSKEEDNKDSILNLFKKYIKGSPRKEKTKVKNRELTQDYIHSLYVKCPYYKWVNEGISPKIQEEFGIGFHHDTNRVVIPHRNWNNGLYLGLIGRTTRTQAEIDMFGFSKYFPIIKYKKSTNLYGLYENMKYIKDVGEVIIFEAEKSVLKMASKGIRNCVAVCCHEITEEQVKILVSLDVDITIAFDQDVEEGFIKSCCEKFKDMRNLYYIYDSLGLLKEKESPADCHYKIWNVLYKRKTRYKYNRSDAEYGKNEQK